MREIKVFAPAKLNLYLDVLKKRPDGFHDLETVFEKIDLKDEIIIREKGRGLKVSSGVADCGQAKKNLVYKAALALFKEAKVKLNLDIEIRKNIPVSAGLGGGSSDAASALRAIDEVFELGLSGKKLFSIANDIGKDVPFFMSDAPFAAGRGRGELLEPLDIKQVLFHIVIKPGIPLSTKSMYERIDKNNCLARGRFFKEMIAALREKDSALIEKYYYNAFESALATDSVYIDRLKALLRGAGCRHSLLSGSGPSVFCTLENRKDAEEAFRKIPKNRDMGVFLAKTYKGGIYGDNRG